MEVLNVSTVDASREPSLEANNKPRLRWEALLSLQRFTIRGNNSTRNCDSEVDIDLRLLFVSAATLAARACRAHLLVDDSTSTTQLDTVVSSTYLVCAGTAGELGDKATAGERAICMSTSQELPG